jgi:hypothetical protein
MLNSASGYFKTSSASDLEQFYKKQFAADCVKEKYVYKIFKLLF